MVVQVPQCSAPELSVLMVLYGGGRLAVEAVRALVEHTDVAFELVIVDNASPDDSLAVVRAGIEGAIVIDAGENLGFGGGNDLAARSARAPLLCLLNPDTKVTSGWARPLIELARRPRVGAVAPLLTDDDGTVREAGAVVDHWAMTAAPGRRDFAGAARVPDGPMPVDYASAACLVVDAAAFAEVGGFDPDYRYAYYEDVDLAFRLWAGGHEVWCHPGARVVHVGGGGSGDPARAIELWNRNRSVFLTKWHGELMARPALGGSDRDVERLRRWRSDRQGRRRSARGPWRRR